MNAYNRITSVLCGLMSLSMLSTENFDIVLKPKWRNLDHNNYSTVDFGGKWVLIGSITFKKKSKELLFLDTISLGWNGEYIDALSASLYKKNLSKEFLPIQDNLICDGAWNKTKQALMFNFEEKETLNPTTTFYIVLTIPEELENTLLNGFFLLKEQCLPKPFKQKAQTAHLSLTINNTNKTVASTT